MSILDRIPGGSSDSEENGKNEEGNGDSSSNETKTTKTTEGQDDIDTEDDSDETTASKGGNILSKLIPFTSGEDEEDDSDPDSSEESGDPLELSDEFAEVFGEDVAQEVKEAKAEHMSEVAAAADLDIERDKEFLTRTKELHQRRIAAPKIEKSDTGYKVGDQFRRVMFASSVPETMDIAPFEGLIQDPSKHCDITMHFKPNPPEQVIDEAENLTEDLEASALVSEEGYDSFGAADKMKREERVRRYRNQIADNDQRPCSMSVYVSARGDTKKELRESVDDIRNQVRRDSGIELNTIERKQSKALVAASPVGQDPLRDDDNHFDPTVELTGQSFGGVLASLTQSRKFEPSGHEWGTHAIQGHPIVKDPFETDTNYNMTVVGGSGSGKSVFTKSMALKTKATRSDSLIIIVDPLNGFEGFAEALNAEKITVGGNQALNPMEIRKPNEEYLNSEAFDARREDPLQSKVKDVMAFIQNYVAQQPGLELKEESQLLQSLVLASYTEVAGITHDIDTHDKESPTLQDVSALAKDARENPQDWVRGAETPDQIREQAKRIGTILRAFEEGGQYEHLSKNSASDPFSGSEVIYIDLSAEEASGGSSLGILGQLMFTLAYEKCKQYSGPALFIVDEAREIFQEQQTLNWLSQRNRHSRHYDTSIRFITQEMDDFFEFEAAEGIVSNSSFKVIHQSDSVDDWGDKFDLNEIHKDTIKKLATGKDADYSQALVQFPEDDQWYPININLGERELAVVDFDEREDSFEDLPGREGVLDRSPIARELQARLRHSELSHKKILDSIFEDWEREIWKILSEDEIEACLSRMSDGENPKAVVYEEALNRMRRTLETLGVQEAAVNEFLDRLHEEIEEQYRSGPQEEPQPDLEEQIEEARKTSSEADD